MRNDNRFKPEAIPKSRLFTNIKLNIRFSSKALVLAFKVHQATLRVSNSSPFFLLRSFWSITTTARADLICNCLQDWNQLSLKSSTLNKRQWDVLRWDFHFNKQGNYMTDWNHMALDWLKESDDWEKNREKGAAIKHTKWYHWKTCAWWLLLVHIPACSYEFLRWWNPHWIGGSVKGRVSAAKDILITWPPNSRPPWPPSSAKKRAMLHDATWICLEKC